MKERRLEIAVPDVGAVTALRTDPTRGGKWILVYAPGAGSNLIDPFGAFAARELAGSGISMIRFEFPYMAAGRKGPDRPPILEATWRAVIEAVRDNGRPIIAGGRSMGGRIASQVVAQGTIVDALALFAYPLHPPGKSDAFRIEHLQKLRLPVLFVSGTRDAFGSPEELRAAAKGVRDSKLQFLEGADHGFSVKKSSGRTKTDVYGEAVGALVDWLAAL